MFPIISPEAILVETTFYKWLEEQDSLGVNLNYFIDAIVKYTGSNAPFKGRSDGKAYRSVFEVFWYNKVRKRDEGISTSVRQ
jgi:hypothetical protein